MWSYTCPSRITFIDERLPETLASIAKNYGAKPLWVVDEFLAAQSNVKELIGAAPGEVFSDVEPNPTVANVDNLRDLITSAGADLLIAIGGGSVIDAAKAAAGLAASDYGSIREVHTGGASFAVPGLPLIAVPSTAGTGSEVTPIAVLDDSEQGVKAPMVSEYFYPQEAVVAPALSATMPKTLTAITGLDALSHAIEGYWSKNHQPLCDLHALAAAKMIFASLPIALDEPGNLTARADMALAATLAGLAFQLPKNAMVHACSFPLSSIHHLPHGTACAFTLDWALRFNAEAEGDAGARLQAMAVHCGFADCDEMANAIARLKKSGGLPMTLREANIAQEAVPEIIEKSFNPLMNNNPRPVSPDDLQRMYEELR